MIFLPIKKARKYIKRETGINLSNYEMTRLSCCGYFDIYLSGHLLRVNKYKLHISELIEDYIPDMFKFNRIIRLNDDYLRIESPSIAISNDGGKESVLFDGVLSGKYITFNDFIKYVSDCQKILPHTSEIVNASLNEIENIANEYNNFILCDLIHLDGYVSNSTLITELYLSLADIDCLIERIKNKNYKEETNVQKELNIPINELWDLGNETDRKEMWFNLVEEKSNNGFICLSVIKRIRAPNNESDAVKQSMRRWRQKTVRYIQRKYFKND